VTKQELNLFEFASSAVAEPSAGTTKVMRRKVIHSYQLGISLYCCPNNIRGDPTTQFGFISPNSPEYQPFSHPRNTKPTIDQSLTPTRNGHRSQASALAVEVGDDPMGFSQLKLIQS
jgi:hypothetical protein